MRRLLRRYFRIVLKVIECLADTPQSLTAAVLDSSCMCRRQVVVFTHAYGNGERTGVRWLTSGLKACPSQFLSAHRLRTISVRWFRILNCSPCMCATCLNHPRLQLLGP